MPNAQHSSASDSHLTPEYVVEPSRRVLGHFDLDPASSEFANRLVRAGKIYTREDDGLVQPWAGRVFLNPPGGALKSVTCGTMSRQALWWGRLSRAWQAGEVEAAVFVGFSLELLQSAQSLLPACPQPLDFPVCVPAKRVKFDVLADELIERLLDQLAFAALSAKQHAAVSQKVAELEPLRGQRVSGDQPTHANVVVLLPNKNDWSGDAQMFEVQFCDLGYVNLGSRH